MIDILWRDGLLPLVATWVEEVEAATGILQTDARTAAVGIILGIVSVVATEDQSVVRLFQPDIDFRGTAAADTVLEGILDERDKQQRRYFKL